MNMHHTDDESCPLCEFKLMSAHAYLCSWFHTVKKRYPNVHIAWAYRDAQDQEQFYLDGRTHCHYPNSPHNKKDQKGNPCSLALDLFQIDEDGVARFSPQFYAKLNIENEADKLPIIWGGKFKTLGDFDHYQYQPNN